MSQRNKIMCGIAGFTRKSSSYNNVIEHMTSALAHRGPDGFGYWSDENICIGHRRLSIIDLDKRSSQPMVDHHNKFVISYNGEIYNYLEIKTQLIDLGYHFLTESDTEVLLYSYKHWGLDCLKKIEGMFAFAIWDVEKQVITLARDRCGIKPLYYLHKNDELIFASEIKGLLMHPAVQVEVDKKALAEYFTFQNFFGHRTLFKNINLLESGTFLQFDVRKRLLNKKQYWDFTFEEPAQQKSEEEYTQELRYLFSNAVKKHMMSDVQIGSYLSGGIDSGSIATIAAQFDKDLKTFCLGFDTSHASALEMGFDETEAAGALAKMIKTQHYSKIISASHFEPALKIVTKSLEEPRVGQSYPNFYAAQLAHEHVKVVLSGAGGDEMFGGYPWRYYRGVQAKNFNEFIDSYYHFWQRLIPGPFQKTFFQPMTEGIKDFNPQMIFKQVFCDYHKDIKNPIDMVNASLYFEAKTFLNGLLIVEDKLNMAVGVESRVPFLDVQLVDFAMKLPMKYKLREIESVSRIDENDVLKAKKYFAKTNDGKLILRKVMQSYLPQEIVERQKQGFSGPDQSWFRNDKTRYIQDRLMESRSPIYEYLDKNTIHALIGEHTSGVANHRLLIWSLLTFDEWLKTYAGAA